MNVRVFFLLVSGLAITLLRTWAGTAAPAHDARLRPADVGVVAGALKLPERAFYIQNSRGWQFLSVPLAAKGEQGVLAASDGVYWNLELRAMVKKDPGATAVVGLVLHYEN